MQKHGMRTENEVYAPSVTVAVGLEQPICIRNLQVQRLHVAVFIAGFVVGTAPLCMTVLSPIIGYFVRT